MKLSPVRRQSGFTLIEILVVIGLLAVLLAIVLVAINPAKHFSDANNTQRRSDVNAILNAVHEYMSSNNGSVPAGIDSTARTITSTAGATNVNLCSVLVPTYIADLPVDPTPTVGTKTPAGSVCTAAGATYNSGYTIQSAAANRITVTAPSAENGVSISVTR
jgi:prepilin-type N-terminal cleavage/methylation domain-containing protein